MRVELSPRTVSVLRSSVRARLMLSLRASRRRSSADISCSVSSSTMVSRAWASEPQAGFCQPLQRARALAWWRAPVRDGSVGEGRLDEELEERAETLLAEDWRGRICSRWVEISSCCSWRCRYSSKAKTHSGAWSGGAMSTRRGSG